MAKPNFTLPNKPAIKSGSILSYNYTDDFTFVPAPLTFNRDSAATRVNEKGLIKDVGYFGPELVQNGDFSEIGSELTSPVNFLGDWFTTGATSITENTFQASGSGIGVYFSLTINKIYKIKVSNVSGDISIRYRTSNGGAGTVAGNFDEFIYVNTYNSTTPNIYLRASSETTATVGNVSVKEVGQNWTFGTGWSIEDGKAVKTSGAGASLSQTLPIAVIGKKYKFTFDTIVTGGAANATLYGVTIPVFSTSGSQEHIIISTSTTGFNFYGTNLFEGSIDNVSVIEVLGDKPRIDYSDSLTEPSLLLEPQSTNLVTYSEDFSNGWNNQNIINIANQTTSPDGANNGTQLQPTQVSGVHLISAILSSSNVKTYSVFAKQNGYKRFRLNTGSSSNGFASFNLNTGSVVSTGGTFFSSSNIEDYGNGWYRCSITFLANAPNNYTLAIEDDDGEVNFLGDGISGIYIWGAQIEELSYATSYIPTAGSTATRLGETANNAGDVNVFNSEEGVLYAEIANLSSSGGDGYLSLSSDDGTQNNRATIRFTAITNNLACQYVIGGVNQTSMDNILTDRTEFNKIAFLYSLNNFVVYVNGVKLSTDTSGAVLPNGTFKKLTFNNGIVAPMYAKIKNVQVFNKTLTDRELEILTIQ